MPVRSRTYLFIVSMSVAFLIIMLNTSIANATTTGNGSLVYAPDPATTFDPAGTTYARILTLKNSGSSNGTILVTYDQLVKVNGVQVYPIYRSTDGGTTWSLLANVSPYANFGTTKTSQPFLYEVPQTVGNLTAGTILLAGNIMPEDKSVPDWLSIRVRIMGQTGHCLAR